MSTPQDDTPPWLRPRTPPATPPRPPAQFDPAAAKAAKDEGMQRAADHAKKEWQAAMLRTVREVALTHSDFTADDVFELAERNGVPRTHENRAFGPVMTRAAKAGYCRKANAAPVNSRRRSLHACPRIVWKSLILGSPP